MRTSLSTPILGLATLAFAGCASPTGSVSVFIQAEDTITDGLDAGTGPEDIQDGWTIRFTKYIAAIGHVHLDRVGGGGAWGTEEFDVVDLRSVPATGRAFGQAVGIPTGRYSFEYEVANATAAMERDSSVSQADFDRMVAEGCTYLIAGTAVNGARTIAFDFCLDAEADYECSSMEGVEGIAVAEGTSTAFMTIHGDHLFFNGFPSGDEGSVRRRAGWLALVDDATGADGRLTNADLAAAPISILPTAEYPLSGAPMVEGMAISNMALYARAQLITQGHLNGEGECSANGVGHDHGV